MSSSSSPRSSTVTQPAPNATSAAVLPVMRHAPAVSLDDDALARTLHARGLAVHAERRVLEAPAEILCPHAVEQRRQALVELRLVQRVPVEDEAAVLARRQDVQRDGGVVRA